MSEQASELSTIELQIAERKAELKQLELKVEEQKTERCVVDAQAQVAVAGLAVLAVLAIASRPKPKKRSLMQKIFG